MIRLLYSCGGLAKNWYGGLFLWPSKCVEGEEGILELQINYLWSNRESTSQKNAKNQRAIETAPLSCGVREDRGGAGKNGSCKSTGRK